MCGICGFNWKDEELARKMADVMTHRGPDQSGVFSDDMISLGHRRLSIIDLSEQGRQPLTNEDGSIHIVYNGEIYNFSEIRAELIEKGHRFQSRTDSEVILHAYEEYGRHCVQRFRGMFAFALWDRNRKMFWLVRDRIGIKPLYYYAADGKFLFASEIKAILECKDVPRRVNRQALYNYIGFEFVPAPRTMFADIHKIPAGHELIWKDGKVEVKTYWDLRFARSYDAPKTKQEAVMQIRRIIDDAVKMRLISDVPLGAFLSGGLDSSTIVAMMRRHISDTLRTYTIGYPDKTFSELDFAEIVHKQFDTEHHVLMIEEMTPELIEKSLWHFDEPMTDLSSIPLMLICGKAKQDVTVCLSGEGGDEVFAGYDRFKASKLYSYFRYVPAPLRNKVVAPLVRLLKDQRQKKGAVNILKRFMDGAILPDETLHLRWQYFSNATQDNLLFSDAFKSDVRFDPFELIRQHMTHCDAEDRINREVYIDTRFMMADSVLMKVDRMSMANSLEIRVPLLDHVLLEYLAQVPGDWKLKGWQTKHIFREALRGILPDNITFRGKQGYSLPVKNILRDQLKPYLTDLLNSSPIIRENTNLAYVNQLIQEHMAMKHNHNHVLWGLMHTAIWHNKFFV